MNPRVTGTLLGIIVVATFITGKIVYGHLPTLIASHWNAAGQANGYMSSFWGVFIIPLILLVLWGVWALLPRIDPIAKGFTGFRYVYDFAWVLIMAFLAYVYALTLYKNLGYDFDIGKAILPALGLLIALLGGLMPYIKRNWFLGIRTPWTLSSDAVWEKTHRFARKPFVAAGALIALAAILPPNFGFGLAIGAILAAVIISIVYSYRVYQHQPQA